jgi:hypothetical protein
MKIDFITVLCASSKMAQKIMPRVRYLFNAEREALFASLSEAARIITLFPGRYYLERYLFSGD